MTTMKVSWTKKKNPDYPLPIPCAKFMDQSLALMLRDLREEVSEVHAAAADYERTGSPDDQAHLAEELTDVITACTTTLASIGYSSSGRMDMQAYVNEKNYIRGYWK